jgi:hypothetical protein
MPSSISELDQGLSDLSALLEREYDRPLGHWRDCERFTDRESLQISRALGLLLKEPIADVVSRSVDDIEASETGGLHKWLLNDAKIAAPTWEGSWQWQLLAEIDNARKSSSGQMMTPSDPRLYLLTIRYERDFFALLAGHFQEFLCERPGLAQCADAAGVIQCLRHVPGLEQASPAFIAGTLLLISKLGPKDFCAWCEDRIEAKDDDVA